MEFFKNIKNSIYGPSYYSNVLTKPLSYSLKYYFLLALIVALIITVVWSFSVVPSISSFVNSALTKVVGYYPQELQINIKDGKASTNVSEPYYIKMPQELKNSGSSAVKINNQDFSKIENLLVIDTKSTFSLQEFSSYSTFMLLTSDSIAYVKDNSVVTTPLSNIPNFTLDKSKVAFFADKIRPFTAVIYPLAIIFILIFQFLAFIPKLIYLFFGALLVWLVAAIKKAKLGYKKSYCLGIHLMTFGIIVNALFTIFGLHPIQYLFTGLLVLSAVINIKNT